VGRWVVRIVRGGMFDGDESFGTFALTAYTGLHERSLRSANSLDRTHDLHLGRAVMQCLTRCQSSCSVIVETARGEGQITKLSE
jgi:hypothetical protein